MAHHNCLPLVGASWCPRTGSCRLRPHCREGSECQSHVLVRWSDKAEYIGLPLPFPFPLWSTWFANSSGSTNSKCHCENFWPSLRFILILFRKSIRTVALLAKTNKLKKVQKGVLISGLFAHSKSCKVLCCRWNGEEAMAGWSERAKPLNISLGQVKYSSLQWQGGEAIEILPHQTQQALSVGNDSR